jgi:hypothetical protein
MAWIAPMIPVIAKAVTAAKVAKGAAIAAKIGTGISALSGAAQVRAQLKQNEKANAFSREMYEKTKADNIKFWDMQNEYNSPQKQMQRLQLAGLNPNMVYQSGGATQSAGSIQTPDLQGGQFRAPDFSQISNPVQGYFDTKIKQAQYDNLLATNTTIQQEAILKAAQTLAETARTKGQETANRAAETNFDYVTEGYRLANEASKANTAFTLAENERKAAMQAPTLEAAIANVLKIKAETANTQAQKGYIYQTIKNLKQDYRLKVFEEDLAKQGIYKNDPLWSRALAQFIEGLSGGMSMKDLGKKTGSWFNNSVNKNSGKSTLSWWMK